ncbi:hypothetical protein D3C81_1964370 [compost metagenome]
MHCINRAGNTWADFDPFNRFDAAGEIIPFGDRTFQYAGNRHADCGWCCGLRFFGTACE